jgi:hypothetical protein
LGPRESNTIQSLPNSSGSARRIDGVEDSQTHSVSRIEDLEVPGNGGARLASELERRPSFFDHTILAVNRDQPSKRDFTAAFGCQDEAVLLTVALCGRVCGRDAA